MILGFIISYADGKLQEYMKPDLESLLEKCYDRALKKWSKNEGIRRHMELGYHRHVQQLTETILHSQKEMNAEDKQLVALWVNEIQKDQDACQIIQNMQIDAILQQSIEGYSEIYNELKKIVGKIDNILSNTEDIKLALQKTNESIQALAKNLNGLDIRCDETIDLICPIPPNVALRKEYIDDLKKILDENHSIHIFGGWHSGKSVTSCLLAQRYEDYTKILLPLSSIPQVSLYPLKIIAQETGKKVIILDGININDSDLCITLCSLIDKLKSDDTLFIINSYESFTSVSMGVESSEWEVEVPVLSIGDVKGMLDEAHNMWGEIIHSVTAGHPQLVQLAVNYVSSDEFSPTDEKIANLFTFSGEVSIADRCRTALGRMVSNIDALDLLNRLLLFDGLFTEKDCRTIAEVEPAIRVPMTLLSSLLGPWVQKNEDKYQVFPLLKKALKPDLNAYVNRDCCDRIADIIISRGSLSLSDALSIFALYVKGSLYEKAAILYLQVIHLLSDKGLLKSRGASLFKGIWHNMPLPTDMPDNLKISIRSAQVAIFGLEDPEQYVNSASDLEQLLDGTEINKRKELSEGYMLLSGYYLVSGDFAKSDELKSKVIPSEYIRELEEKFDDKQLRLFQFHSVKTFDGLKVIMDKQAAEDFAPFDLYFEGCNYSIRCLLDGIPKELQNKELHSTIDYAYAQNIGKLYPFAISCLSALIKESADSHDIIACKRLYDQYNDLLSFDFGRLQLNFSLAVAYENAGNAEQAEVYYSKAASVSDLSINAYESLVSHVSYAKYLGKRDSQSALDILVNFMKYSGFNSYLADEHRSLFFGTLSIAYWFCGKKIEAVKMSNLVLNGIYKEKDNLSDLYKEIAVRHSAMLTQYMNLALNGVENPDSIMLGYDMYFNSIRDVLSLYSSTRVFGCLAISCLLNDLIIKNDESTYDYVKKGLEFFKTAEPGSLPASILTNMGPLLLSHDDMDGVEYLMSVFANSIKSYNDKPANIELVQLSTCLLQIACYRTIRQSGGYFFDDERVRNFVQAVLERMGRQDVVDEYIKSIGVETFDFNSIEDDIIKTVAYIWRINDYLASDTVILLHRVYVLWSRNWKQHSIISLLNAFFEAVLYYKIKNERNAFNLGYTNVSDLIRRAKLCEGFESSRRLAVAYCYLLKNPPKMNADQEEFFMA